MDGDTAGEWFTISEGVPDQRCGLTTSYPDSYPGNVTCYRPTWQGFDRCIWHADTDNKTADRLADWRGSQGERLDGAILRGLTLHDRLDFTGCNLTGADCTRTTFRGTTLSQVTAPGAYFTSVTFDEATLNDSDFSGANFYTADISGATVRRSDFVNAGLWNATLTDADCYRSDFTDADLVDADLSESLIRDGTFTGADLTRATLRATHLSECDFINATLERATLTQVDLFDADLRGTKLYGAVLSDIKLNTDTDVGHYYPDTADLDKAVWTLSHIEDLSRQNALPGQVRDIFTRRKDRRRQFCWHHSLVPTRVRQSVRELKTAASTYRTRIVGGIRRRLNKTDDQATTPTSEVDSMAATESGDTVPTPKGSGPTVTRWERYRNTAKWVWLAVIGLTTRYGESPRRVIGSSLSLVMICALLYPLLGGVTVSPSGNQLTVFEPVGTPLDSLPGGTWLASLYFSLVTFTTLGYGDIQPASAPSQILAGFESFLGAALMALLVAVLARRITR